jgi:farnesyl diphosphate synthase
LVAIVSFPRYKCIVKYKTAFYSFYLPVAMGMMMSGLDMVDDKPKFDDALAILLEMGEFFQIQDDYLDCYGTPEKIGKIGTDIQDNKCGWLIVQAKGLASPEQLQILKDNYAKKADSNVEKVKAVYRDLDLETVFRRHEEESFVRLQGLITDRAGDLPLGIFTDFAKKIYKREK